MSKVTTRGGAKASAYREDVKDLLKNLKADKKSNPSHDAVQQGQKKRRRVHVGKEAGQKEEVEEEEEEQVDDEMEEPQTDNAKEGPTVSEGDDANGVISDEEIAADSEVKKIMDRAAEEEAENNNDDDDITEVESDGSQAAKTTADQSGGDSYPPDVVEISDGDGDDGDDDIESVEGSSCEDEDDQGDPNRPPGEGAAGNIEPEFLVPFKHGWIREVVQRKGNKNSATQYDIFYVPPPDTPYRTREAKRKRRSKADQDKYFEDFPNPELSVSNFNYVRKALGLNNAAYEVVRKENSSDPPPFEDPIPDNAKEKPTNKGQKQSSSGKGGKKSRVSYKEVEESSGLIESDDGSDIEYQEGFDLDVPITLQVNQATWALRTENRKRRRYRNPQTCCTPPLAEDILWTGLDDDPMGIFTDLGGRSSPSTPPPLRAMRLTPNETATKIVSSLESVRAEAAKVDVLKAHELIEEMASHDIAIRKFKHFVANTSRNSFSQVRNAPFNRNNGGRTVNRSYMQPRGQSVALPNFMIKVKLPMQSINGKRPVVELVMEQNGKYQPIKFSNNMQVTESIPKSLFERANALRKTFYQKATQIPRVGTKTLFLAVNPSANGIAGIPGISIPTGNSQASRPAPLYNKPPTNRPRQPSQVPNRPHHHNPPFRNATASGVGGGGSRSGGSSGSGSSPSDQVSILVRPQKGPQSKPVLLNVPRSVAAKVKPGTTLSFSASNDQKYVVIDSKIHPPVRSGPPTNGSGPPPVRKPTLPLPQAVVRQKAGPSVSRGLPFRPSNGSSLGNLNLPKSVSIRPVPSAGVGQNQLANRPSVHSNGNRPLAQQPVRRPSQPSSILSSGEVIGAKSPTEPCTPYCPGTSGFPELECQSCQSLFHAKCAGIPPSAVPRLMSSFKCGNCDPSGRTLHAVRKPAPTVIDLD